MWIQLQTATIQLYSSMNFGCWGTNWQHSTRLWRNWPWTLKLVLSAWPSGNYFYRLSSLSKFIVVTEVCLKARLMSSRYMEVFNCAHSDSAFFWRYDVLYFFLCGSDVPYTLSFVRCQVHALLIQVPWKWLLLLYAYCFSQICLLWVFTDLGLLLQRVFLEGNPYLLGLTMIVSLFHSLFDFLAFKNGTCTAWFI